MKNRKRISRILNFVAFNILFFALYLNFIHKDNSVATPANKQTVTSNGTVLVSNPDQYLNKMQQGAVSVIPSRIN